jgi:hypothetical protein
MRRLTATALSGLGGHHEYISNFVGKEKSTLIMGIDVYHSPPQSKDNSVVAVVSMLSEEGVQPFYTMFEQPHHQEIVDTDKLAEVLVRRASGTLRRSDHAEPFECVVSRNATARSPDPLRR